MVGTVAVSVSVSVALAGLARSPCKEHVRGAVATKGVEARVLRVAFINANVRDGTSTAVCSRSESD